VTEFLAHHGAPGGRLSSDLLETLNADGWHVDTLSAFGNYRPGGLRPIRLWNLMFLHVALPFVAAWCKICSVVRGEPLLLLTISSPPLIHWTSSIVGKLLSIPVMFWLQDAHPEIEARILEHRGHPRIASLLRSVDKVLCQGIDAVVTLDRSMEALARAAGFRAKIEVVAPWSTYIEPSFDLREPTLVRPRLIYAGNYGAAHDLSVLAEALRARFPCEKRPSLTFVGMSADAADRLRSQFPQHEFSVTFLGRLPHSKDVFSVIRSNDFGIVSLKNDQVGVCCPSKALTYVSQGTPLLYVGPQNTLCDELCEEGWGMRLDDFCDSSSPDRQRIASRVGTRLQNPRKQGLHVLVEMLASLVTRQHAKLNVID
jgi:hypothetical protein